MAETVYFLGIGGTLMGSLAMLAKEMGFEVLGSDDAIYPPMSTQLARAKIQTYEGFDARQLEPLPDMVVIGNAKQRRGVEAVEIVLERKLNYLSAAEWLATYVLPSKKVVAVSGTHGKTTATSMVAWILEAEGIEPGFLVGGVPTNFGSSSKLGRGDVFVVEADEYDTSYFDRRSKFLHYRPDVLTINNLEFDHADIFANLEEIEYQFHHLLRAVPRNGRVIVPADDPTLAALLQKGCWTPISYTWVNPDESMNSKLKQDEEFDVWLARTLKSDGSHFTVEKNDQHLGEVQWSLLGEHNVSNALIAAAAASEVGVPPARTISHLATFAGVERRMQKIASTTNLSVYDDFAHHPTAIDRTLQGLRQHVQDEEIVAVIEPRTHTMSLGSLRDDLVSCWKSADAVWWFKGENITWDMNPLLESIEIPTKLFHNLDPLINEICQPRSSPTHVVLMSNGSFGGIYEMIKSRLDQGEGV